MAILSNGEFEEVLLDTRFDMHSRGAARFVAFRTDRLFKLTLNRELVQWGKPQLAGSILYRLVQLHHPHHAGEDHAVFLEATGQRRLIRPEEMLDLSAPGIEHFVTGPRSFEIVVNARPQIVLDRRVKFGKVVQFAFPNAQTSRFAFSMTYRHVASEPHQGELAAGGFVEVKNGSVFNVTRTVQS